MKKIIGIVLLVLLGVTANVYSQDTVLIKTTAQCEECKQKIESALNFTKGVKSASLNMETMTVAVVYNPDKTNVDKIRTVISKAGYDADSIPADPKAYARLKPCCTKDGHKHD